MYNYTVREIYFATTNQMKIQIAQTICVDENITVKPVSIEIDKIQSENPELIIKDKVKRAYKLLGEPVIVSDDSWNIRALNGFPGAYMKSVNHWFTPEDFLRLMDGIDDRKVTIHQYLAYTNGKITKIFKNDLAGNVIHEAKGKDNKSPIATVIALDADNGKTIAQVFEQGNDAVIERYKRRPDVWHKFLNWYIETDL